MTGPIAAVVMLYEGVTLELRRTVASIEEKAFDRAFDHLQRATTILRGLCHSLDFASGGAFAERMHETYMRLILSGLHAFGKPDAVARFNKLIVAVTDLRDAWAEIRDRQGKGLAGQ